MDNNFLKLTEVNKEMFLNNNEALNCKDICNMFDKYPDNEIELQISLDEITSVIKKMKKKTSVGPDGLSA